MNTYKIEAYSVEPGDQIVIGEDVYKVIESDYSLELDNTWVFVLVDEEGYKRSVNFTPQGKVEILVD
jgi:hypothetical protein